MANNFYRKSGNPQSNTPGSMNQLKAEFNLLQAAFDLFPMFAGNAGKFLAINSTGTGLEPSDGAINLNDLSDPGYFLLDNGFMLQWGTNTQSSTDRTITFLNAFPTAVLMAWVVQDEYSPFLAANWDADMYGYVGYDLASITNTQMTVKTRESYNHGANIIGSDRGIVYLAIGY